MFDKLRLKKALVQYKKEFVPNHWNHERYKWEAAQCFQDNWDIKAEKFADMLSLSLSKAKNFLVSTNNYKAGMIIEFAKVAPEDVRSMFMDLFDETKEVYERIHTFKIQSTILLDKYGNGAKQHYQHENAISTYLWLRYPDKYYIYKYREVKTTSDKLKSNYKFKKGAYADNLRNFYAFYNEICEELKQDTELVKLFRNQLTDTCYADPELKTLTFDVGFYISRDYIIKDNADLSEDGWFPSLDEYDPGITTEEWSALLQDREVFTLSSLEIVKRIKDNGGSASCQKLASKYGENMNFYNSGSVGLAKRIVKKTSCPVMLRNSKKTRWWPVLYVGRDATADEEGVYIWKLREELSEALENIDLSEVPLYSEASFDVDRTPAIWKISEGSISEDYRSVFEERKVVVVHSETRAKGTSRISQGQRFIEEIKNGDYFYLCYGNSIRLLGRFIGNEAVPNSEMNGGYYERSYRFIVNSKDLSAYNGIHKWWTPNDNSTCVKVEAKDQLFFEQEILQPYFEMSLQELFNDNQQHYWWLNANPKIWSFSNLQVGEVKEYTLYNHNGNKRRIFQNFMDAKAGDLVIGYESNPVKQIVALLNVSAANDGQKIYFEKIESLENPIDYQIVKACPELEKMEFFKNPNGSFFKLTKDEYDFLMDMIHDDSPLNTKIEMSPYMKEDFLSEVYMSEEKYDRLVGILLNKMNIILQGAPGVGKTFAAKRLAYSVMGEKDDNRIEFVQFHQNYSYEDFMMGYKPSGNGFELKYGVFYRFCKKAENCPGKKFFFIIDEINRGNLSKIFGELLMLIEKDYRGTKATLAYNGMSFTVPENLYIIGMMNTADRSLAMIDYALRRRFSFFDMDPCFESKGFIAYQLSLENETFDELIMKVIALNEDIRQDKSLGKSFCIGHSYFCGRKKENCTDECLQSIVDYDILPMLQEYWFDDDSKVQRWNNILHGVFE